MSDHENYCTTKGLGKAFAVIVIFFMLLPVLILTPALGVLLGW